MSRTQYWILTAVVLVVGPFIFLDVFLNHLVRNDERKVVVLERVIHEGGEYSTRWRQLAVRIYQAGQQDAALKDVLVREHIDIQAKPNPGASPAQDPLSPATTAPLTPASNSR